jgi:hypothetical protein
MPSGSKRKIIRVAGAYAGATFSVATDHHGGTDITANVPGAWPAAAASPATSPLPVRAEASPAAWRLPVDAFVQAAAAFGGLAAHGADRAAPVFSNVQASRLLSPGAHAPLSG